MSRVTGARFLRSVLDVDEMEPRDDGAIPFNARAVLEGVDDARDDVAVCLRTPVVVVVVGLGSVVSWLRSASNALTERKSPSVAGRGWGRAGLRGCWKPS